MSQQKTIVIIGGGYAGINLIDALKKESMNKELKSILIDKHPYHFLKVKLFKAIVKEDFSNLQIPFEKYCTDGIEFIQGVVKTFHDEDQKLEVLGEDGLIMDVKYNQLIIAVGSVIREVSKELGGISLSSVQNAREIRKDLLEKVRSGKSKLHVSVIGGGISGFETSAEIAAWLKNETEKTGILDSNVEVLLINEHKRLLSEVPEKVIRKLENRLTKLGVNRLHNGRAEHEEKFVYLLHYFVN